MTMRAFLAAVFLFSLGTSLGIEKNFKHDLNDPLLLDMAPNSVDDMYTTCEGEMLKKVMAPGFIQNERNKDTTFSLAWDEAEKKWNRKPGKKPSGILTKEQIMAIYAYTLDKPKIYPEFNIAVRTKKNEYKTTFKYHALHFFLTSAIKTLNSLKPEAERCLTGFRRVDSYSREDALNKQIRFGSFTSSSMDRYPRPDKFGNKTCFEIYTCFGADISLYSKLGESEREVLIPPYEILVTDIEKRSEERNLPCEFVYKVKSTGNSESNLDCALFTK
ncbi:LOW QUALITY PROTEIN: ecto-ADP-ribosyltransferase 5-like [Odontesthes bonariensis]